MFCDRKELYKAIENERNSKLIVYVTGTRSGLETQIANDVLPMFVEHLDRIGDAEKISLLLYTNGGDTLAAWSLVNLIRSFCKNFEVIIPSNCFSSGTLICLGANNLLMTKQACLGPIDPSVNGPLNPMVPGISDPNAKVPVSVEFVNAYIDLAKNELGISDQNCLTQILIDLSQKIHPLTLGQVYKSSTQIQMLAKKLLSLQHLDEEKEERIIKFLCSESGSHDYSIRRREASEYLGLTIEKPTMELYGIIKDIFDDISNELELNNVFNPGIMLASQNPCNYSFRRVLIESLVYGTDVFISEGTMQKGVQSTPAGPREFINDNRVFEGWRHESNLV